METGLDLNDDKEALGKFTLSSCDNEVVHNVSFRSHRLLKLSCTPLHVSCLVVDEHTERIKLILSSSESMPHLYICAYLVNNNWGVFDATFVYRVDGLKVRAKDAFKLGYLHIDKSIKCVEIENLSSEFSPEYRTINIERI